MSTEHIMLMTMCQIAECIAVPKEAIVGFLENLDSTTSTGHLEQTSTLFAIFQQPQGVQCCWKIAKKRNHIAKFGCGNGAILVILFKKMG